jgi:L-fuconolactonase
MPTVDSHHHFWQLSQPFNYRWLDARCSRDQAGLHAAGPRRCSRTGIEKSVVVQTQHDLAENRQAVLAEQNEFIAGVVGWVDLAALTASGSC